jgi:hypothetical protein
MEIASYQREQARRHASERAWRSLDDDHRRRLRAAIDRDAKTRERKEQAEAVEEHCARYPSDCKRVRTGLKTLWEAEDNARRSDRLDARRALREAKRQARDQGILGHARRFGEYAIGEVKTAAHISDTPASPRLSIWEEKPLPSGAQSHYVRPLTYVEQLDRLNTNIEASISARSATAQPQAQAEPQQPRKRAKAPAAAPAAGTGETVYFGGKMMPISTLGAGAQQQVRAAIAATGGKAKSPTKGAAADGGYYGGSRYAIAGDVGERVIYANADAERLLSGRSKTGSRWAPVPPPRGESEPDRMRREAKMISETAKIRRESKRLKHEEFISGYGGTVGRAVGGGLQAYGNVWNESAHVSKEIVQHIGRHTGITPKGKGSKSGPERMITSPKPLPGLSSKKSRSSKGKTATKAFASADKAARHGLAYRQVETVDQQLDRLLRG